jgi:hypothetical protein
MQFSHKQHINSVPSVDGRVVLPVF